MPACDPWSVYGPPIAAYPGSVDVPGVFYPRDDLYFGGALGVGLLAGFGWAWNDWGFDWHARRVVHDRAPATAHGEPPAGSHFGGHTAEGFHPGGTGPESLGPGILPLAAGARPGIAGELRAGRAMEEGFPAGGEHLGGAHEFGGHFGGSVGAGLVVGGFGGGGHGGGHR